MGHMQLTGHQWRPRFIWGLGAFQVDWKIRLPQRPWNQDTDTVGGSRTSAGGVPASYIVRRDYGLEITLRLYETELDTLQGLVNWGQSAESFIFYPDREETQQWEVYLEEPEAGTSWRPTRMADFPKIFEVTLMLRKVDGSYWNLDYFPCVDN